MRTRIVLFVIIFFAGMALAQAPFGALDCPSNNPAYGCYTSPSQTLAGSVNVAGWALSQYTVARVSVYREPVTGEPPGLIYSGDAGFVPASRPDIANSYSNYPNNNWGWGYNMLTNGLPDSNGDGGHGNGTYRLHVIAYDPSNRSTDFGQVTIYLDNKDSKLPFGTFDTPSQGGTVSGTAYLNWGWALTPQPNIIPTNGSTIQVSIDGGNMVSPTAYNLERCDIDNGFPGYRNSGVCGGPSSPGPVGYYQFDTTPYVSTNPYGNGLHTIGWYVVDSAGNAQGIGTRWFAAVPSTLAPDTMAPSSGSGATQTFTFAASSPNGYSQIDQVQVLFNWGVDGAGACLPIYDQRSNALYLIDDTGSIWTGGFAPGSPNTLSNSQCSINVALVTVSGSGNRLVLSMPIAFPLPTTSAPPFIGLQNVYENVTDLSGNVSGWQLKGTWTAHAALYSQLPSGLSASPINLTGASQTFTFHASDLNGYGYIPQEDFLFATSINGANACYVVYNRAARSIGLVNDAGNLVTWGVLGATAPLTNSQCSINLAQSNTTGTAGNDLYLNIAITFTSSFAGTKNVYQLVYDHTALYTGWAQVGTWNVMADFSLSSASPGLIISGHSSSSGLVTATPINGPIWPITFSWANRTAWPSGLNASFQTNPVTSSTNIAVTTTAATPDGLYTLAFVAVSGGIQHVGSIAVHVVPVLYTESEAPGNLVAGSTATFTAHAWGGEGAYRYVWSNSGGGPLCPGYPNCASTYSFTVPNAGSVTVNLTVTDQSGQTANFVQSITVRQAPDFQLSSTPVTIAAGLSGSVTETVNSIYGFNSSVSFAWQNQASWPVGMTATNFSPTSGSTNATISTTANTPAGTYGLLLTGTSGNLSHQGVVSVAVTAPASFITSVLPPPSSPARVVAGGIATYAIGVTDLNNFSGTVNLGASALPAGVTASFTPSSLSNSGSSQMKLTVASTVSPGTYSFTVTGSSGLVSSPAAASLTVTAPSGSLSITTSSALPGNSVGVQYQLNLGATGGSPQYTWSISSGALPGGISLTPDGILSGFPSATGTYSFTAQVFDSASNSASRTFSLTIGPAAQLTILTTSLPNGQVNTPYESTQPTVTASGGVGTYTWSLTSGPSWLSIGSTTGALMGTTSSGGTYNLTAQVVDSNGTPASKVLTIVVSTPLKEYIRLGGRVIAIENQ